MSLGPLPFGFPPAAAPLPPPFPFLGCWFLEPPPLLGPQLSGLSKSFANLAKVFPTCASFLSDILELNATEISRFQSAWLDAVQVVPRAGTALGLSFKRGLTVGWPWMLGSIPNGCGAQITYARKAQAKTTWVAYPSISSPRPSQKISLRPNVLTSSREHTGNASRA